MNLTIAYTKEKDIENFLNGQKAINRPTPTLVEAEFSKRFSEFNQDNLSDFIDKYSQEESYDVTSTVDTFSKQWSGVEEEFIKKCELLFGVSYPIERVTAYVTINNRCTYNMKGGYFFLSVRARSPVKSIMHELLHFYTLKAFPKRPKELNLTPLQYNDIKESFTVLLNTEFKELMKGTNDSGYPQHQEMRKKVLKLREEGHTIQYIFEELTSDFSK